MEHNIYIVFSATPYKMGKFIRKVTRQPYNHVSVALDEKLETMYSFARHYMDTPFYGGLVRESRTRYFYNNASSNICVCEISLSEEEYQSVITYIQEMQENSWQYLYNTFSAVFTPVRRRILIDKSFTCTEFAVEILARLNPEIASNRFYSIMELKNILKDCVVYEGVMTNSSDEYATSDEEFLQRHNVFGRSYLTFILLRQLAWRFYRAI